MVKNISWIAVVVLIAIALSIGAASFTVSRYFIESQKPGKDATKKLANEAYDRGDFRTASYLYERYLREFEPTDNGVRIDFGYALFRNGQEDRGIAETKNAIGSGLERNTLALFNLGVMYYGRNQIDSATYWFSQSAGSTTHPEIADRAKTVLEQLKQTSNQP